MTIEIDQWVADVDGDWLDRDGFPKSHPFQCHDVWLDYANRVHGMPIANPNLGWAPGTGYTNQVWRQFPAVAGVEKFFRKKWGTAGLGKGDVVFWDAYAGGLPHVVVALGPVEGDTFLAVTQNPGATRVERMQAAGVIGYLEPVKSVVSGPRKTVAQLADEVLAGVWGNNPARARDLAAAGYDAVAVQSEVNARANKKPAGQSYTVQAGDTLSAIAQRFGTSWQAIQQANRLPDANVIHRGQVLVIPGAAAPRTYTVQRGDTLSGIAAKFGTTWQALQSANGIANANVINPGQVLRIP